MGSFFDGILTAFGGGSAKADIQVPQVGTTTEESQTVTGVQPQSPAEDENIRQAKLDEEQRRRNRQGQDSTILAGDLSLNDSVESSASTKKTLLGA